MKKCFYTCILGEYDCLKEPRLVYKDFDYFFFTDNKQLLFNKPKIYKPILVTDKKLDDTREARKRKILCHDFLRGYDMSIWLDGSIFMQYDISGLISDFVNDERHIAFFEHPTNYSMLDEARACIKLKKDDPIIINKQVKKYREEGYSDSSRSIMSGVIFRKHTKEIKKAMKAWFGEIVNHSSRDQISWSYIEWKQKINTIKMDQKEFKEHFNWFRHGRHKLYNF